jgi:protein-S-isoprenylcysteine O-methyltransferase Ste14
LGSALPSWARLSIRACESGYAIAMGCLLLVTGFFLRVWATFHFYENQAKVISLKPQLTLLTTGPYHFSRNPLHLGGSVFILFGAALSLGSPVALATTAIHLPLVDLFISQKERQFEMHFGETWERYRNRVRRWI